jgi:hypothetical protein
MEGGESQFSVAVVPGCADYVRSTIVDGLVAACYARFHETVSPSMVVSHSLMSLQCQVLSDDSGTRSGSYRRPPARRPSAFPVPPKTKFRKERENFLSGPSRKEVLGAWKPDPTRSSSAMGAPSHREITYGATPCRRIESTNS